MDARLVPRFLKLTLYNLKKWHYRLSPRLPCICFSLFQRLPELFEYVLPADADPATEKAEFLHVGSVASQVMLGGFETVADCYYFVLFVFSEALVATRS